MKVICIRNKDSIQNATEVLKKGGILIFPTDTVYGIGCLLNESAINRLYKIKMRPSSQPTAILLSFQKFDFLCSSVKSSIVKNKMDKDFLDGKITLIINKDDLKIELPKILIKDGKVGIRIPKNLWLEKLIDNAGPIVVSSANKKGGKTPTKFNEIDYKIIEQADLSIKTDLSSGTIGKQLSGKPSRIYDIELKQYYR